MNILTRMVFLICIVTPINNLLAQQTPETPTFSNTVLYDSVLDILFPTVKRTNPVPVETIRYTYGNTTEMQLTIRNTDANTYEVNIWYLPNGSRTIWDQLAQLMSNDPDMKATEAAASIQIRHQSMLISKSSGLGHTIQEGHNLRFPAKWQDFLFLEGSSYQIIIDSPSEDINIMINGPQNGRRSNNPVIKWLASLRSQIDSQLSVKH